MKKKYNDWGNIIKKFGINNRYTSGKGNYMVENLLNDDNWIRRKDGDLSYNWNTTENNSNKNDEFTYNKEICHFIPNLREIRETLNKELPDNEFIITDFINKNKHAENKSNNTFRNYYEWNLVDRPGNGANQFLQNNNN